LLIFFAQKTWRYPVLVFIRNYMVAHAEELDRFYFKSVFFFYFPFNCVLKSIAEFHRAARELPQAALIFCFSAPLGCKNFSFPVYDDCADASFV